MNKITKFRAEDGSEHTTEEAALKRDQLHADCIAAMAPLGTLPKGVTDGKGWLRHDPEIVNRAKDRILEICREQGFDKHYPAFKARGRDCHPLSIIGRILCDNDGPLNTAWNRFCRIDTEGREHGQCYYAYTNGPEPTHVCIEDRTITRA